MESGKSPVYLGLSFLSMLTVYVTIFIDFIDRNPHTNLHNIVQYLIILLKLDELTIIW